MPLVEEEPRSSDLTSSPDPHTYEGYNGIIVEKTGTREPASRGASLRLLRPSLAIPSIMLVNDTFTIWTDCLSASDSSVWRVELLAGNTTHTVALSIPVQDGTHWYMTGSLPEGIDPGLYDLALTMDGIDALEENAVCIRDSFPENVSFVHITDTHVCNDTYEQVRKCFEEINLIDPDLVLISGDLVHEACPEQFEMFLELQKNLTVPAYPTIGNHDYANTFGFDNDPCYYEEYITPVRDFSFDLGPYHFIGMDSGHTVDWPYNSGSGFSQEQIRWLEGDLNRNADSAMTFITMHIPAVDQTGITIKNNREEFISTCQQYGVDMTLSGHLHWDALYDGTGDKKGGDTGHVEGTIFLQTTSSGMKSPLYDFSGYRLVRIKNGQMDTYTYDYDSSGKRDAASSMPFGMLRQSFLPGNNGTAERVTATVHNDLREHFEGANVRFLMPEPTPGMGYVAENGSITRMVETDGASIYYVGTDLPAESISEITLYQADFYPPIIGEVRSEEDSVSRMVYGNGANVRIVVEEKNGEEHLSGTISIRSVVTGFVVMRNTLTEVGGGKYYYDWNTTGLQSGEYEVRITLLDPAGNEDCGGGEAPDHVIMIDNTPPVLEKIISRVGNDTDDVYERGSSVEITVMEANGERGLAGVMSIRSRSDGEYVLYEQRLTEVNRNYSLNWDTSGLPCGNYEVFVSLRDGPGNTAGGLWGPIPDHVIFLADSTPPEIYSVSSMSDDDSDGTYSLGSKVRILVLEKDMESGLEGDVIIRDPDGEKAVEGSLFEIDSGTYCYDWNTSGLRVGEFTVECTLRDGWGNEDGDGLPGFPDLVITLGDTVRPDILEVFPGDGAEKVPADVNITVEFSEEMKLTLLYQAFRLEGPDGKSIIGEWVHGPGNASSTFHPMKELVYNRTYRCSIAKDMTDTAGNVLRETYSWSFTTEDHPPDNQRPVLEYVSPAADVVFMEMNTSVRFSVVAADGDGDSLEYMWFADDVPIRGDHGSELSYAFFPGDDGCPRGFTISIRVSDGELSAMHEWYCTFNGTGGDGHSGDGGADGERGSDNVSFRYAVITATVILAALMTAAVILVVKKKGGG